MKTFEEDKELKQFLRSVKLESPADGFSARVMNRVFEEKAALEQVKQEPVLGRGFWIILALFAALFAVIALVSGTPATESAPSILPEINTDAVLTGYRSFFDKLGALPAGIAGIFMASSLLILLEKLLSSRSHVLS
jgi:hypothetical protein